ncbi:MAG: hypothetical protein C0478_01745 [Planctomyces sp.]|jgi:tetratricopeptide (TPR) repeat protein|nr:hypothetical protein [Planctomyces sp.]
MQEARRMKIAERLLLVVVMLEILVSGGLLVRKAWSTVPRIPNEHLADPLIIPDLQQLAQSAANGTARDWTRLGEALLGKGFYAHAEQTFRDALLMDPNSLRTKFGLAFSLDRLGRMAESSGEYEKVLAMPARSEDDKLTHAHALYAMGRNALRLEQAEQAEQLFRRNLAFVPAAYQHSKLLIRSGRAAEALPTIDRVLEQVEFSLEFQALRQRALTALGRDREAFHAAAMVERSAHLVSLNFNTEYVSPFDQMTGIARKMKSLEQLTEGAALTDFEKEVQELHDLIGDTPQISKQAVDEQLLYNAVSRQQPERVFELLAKLRALGQEHAWMLEAEGDAWRMQDDSDRAAASWQRALLLSPSRSLHDKLAAYYGEQQPQQRDWHLGRSALAAGIATYRRNHLKDALPPLREAARLLPDKGSPWFYIGEMNFHLNQLEEAQSAYQKCLELQPSHGRAAKKLGHLEKDSAHKSP